jgi:toxin ParE1/3/4
VAQIVWSATARQRLIDIVEYVAQDSPDAARTIHASIVRNVRRLEQWPLSSPWIGALYPELAQLDKSYRVLVVRPYLVFFRLLGEEIRVLTVRHGSQLPPMADALAD